MKPAVAKAGQVIAPKAAWIGHLRTTAIDNLHRMYG